MPRPVFIGDTEKRACKAWRCRESATWKLWAEYRCTDCMIRTGFLCGPVRMPGDQLELAAA